MRAAVRVAAALTRVVGVPCLLAAFLSGCRTPAPQESERPAPQAPVPAMRQEPASAAERARIHTELGASYLQIRRYAVAIQELEEALRADPRHVPAHTTLGLVYMEIREDEKARASFQRALRIDPSDSEANNSYGLFLCDRGREAESMRYFATALRNPLYAAREDAHVNAGICARRKGDDATALAQLELALEIRPDEPRALVNLARLHLDQGRPNSARGLMARFFKGNSTPDAGSLWLAVRIERALGDREAAARFAVQLETRHPESAETRRMREGKSQ